MPKQEAAKEPSILYLEPPEAWTSEDLAQAYQEMRDKELALARALDFLKQQESQGSDFLNPSEASQEPNENPT